MSASNAAAEPSMEEILSSIRQAINEDIPGAVPESAGDPFASGSSAEAAFSAPPPGQAFDATVHESHDPFAELTRKLNETRESVQKQMHGVSSNLKSEQAEDAPPTAAQAAPTAQSLPQEEPIPAQPAAETAPVALPEEPEPVRAATFSAGPTEMPQPEPADEPAASSAMQALTARVAEEQKPASEPASVAASTQAREASPAPQTSEHPSPPDVSGGATKPKMPELSWASAERSAADHSITVNKPQSSQVEAPSAPEPKLAPAIKPKEDIDPFPKLTALVERGAAENPGTVKTDQAMVDLVLRRILEPAVKSWLDDNLPKIVTEVVREEVRRVASQSN